MILKTNIGVVFLLLILKNSEFCHGKRKFKHKHPQSSTERLIDSTTEVVTTITTTALTSTISTSTVVPNVHTTVKINKKGISGLTNMDDSDILPKKKVHKRKKKISWPQYVEPIYPDEDKDLNDIRVKNRKILTEKYPPIVKVTNENKTELCTGTVIEPTWVLTTKNCVRENIKYWIFDPKCNCNWMKVSKYLYPKIKEHPNKRKVLIMYNIIDIINHNQMEDYKINLTHVNIALLKLNRPWPDFKNLAKIPVGPIDFDLADVFTRCSVLSYETIHQFRGGRNIISHRMIEQRTRLLPIRRYCSLPNTNCGWKFDVRSKIFSLYYPGGKQCFPDEGYPLFCSQANKPLVLYGVAELKTHFCGFSRMGYQDFTRIDTYVNWIHTILGEIN